MSKIARFFGVVLLCPSVMMAASLPQEGSLYFLCASDEDGCPEDHPEYCACIPYHKTKAHETYCLDFNQMICQPLSEVKECDPRFRFNDQGSCLATMFQSESFPPCPTTTFNYCKENNTYFCDETGAFDSCKKW